MSGEIIGPRLLQPHRSFCELFEQLRNSLPVSAAYCQIGLLSFRLSVILELSSLLDVPLLFTVMPDIDVDTTQL